MFQLDGYPYNSTTMTTTAQAVPSLEVSAPDDNMDVLSDTGFDFGDGDIDLDLDTAPSVQDDDMSLNDTATDGGIDIDEPAGDQDDFMADHGDFIEEDDMYNDGDMAAESQTVIDVAPTFEADMLAPPDEDLIDYSDDEAQQQVKMHSPSGQEGELAQVVYEAEAASVPVDDQNDPTQGDADPIKPTENTRREVQTHDDGDLEDVEEDKAIPEHQAADADVQREDHNEDYTHADNGGVPLPIDEHSHSHSDKDDADDVVTEQQAESQQDAGNTSESDHNDTQQIDFRPVSVNYAGNELWLFKQHDLDESGDFLLDDLSVAKSSISNLFRACRLSLGDDVSGEHEIGFRFDHLHNLELYEDNTACVAVSLERLVDLYHTLQAQDGNDDPECFYVTLQFRPRFATLLADVAQYAEQGSGYSALDAAVAAGETHFSNAFSSASTEHDQVEWDQDIDDEDASSPGSAHGTTADGVDVAEHDKQHLDEDGAQIGEQDEEDETQEEHASQEHPHGLDSKADWNQTLGTQDEGTHPDQENVDSDSPRSTAPQVSIERAGLQLDPKSDAAEQQDSEPQDKRTPDQIAHDKQEAEDFVDYSDDEDDQEIKSVPVHEPSPSSSTVQGDDPSEIPESGLAHEHDVHDNETTTEAGFDENDDNATLLTQTQYGDDANHYAFQDYTETYEQGDPFQGYQADGTAGDPFEANSAYNGDTNQDFADYNFQDLEAEVSLGFDEQPLDEANRDEHGNETFEAVEDVTHADAFLDFDNAPEWAIDADPAPNLPGEDAVLLHDDAADHGNDEGGAVEQPAATTSSAADLAPTSSNDPETLSLQGQKRSIDEVGDGIDIAPNSTGTARYSMCERLLNTDLYLPDAKRPRV